MPLLVGIDEAGYGPLLGPLVVGATVWRAEPRQIDADYWELLSECVVRSGIRRKTWRLRVGDSKAIYDRKKGLHTLERAVLAFAQVAGIRCDSLADLLAALGADEAVTQSNIPWYADLSTTLPTDPVRAKFDAIAARLERVLDAAGVACCGLMAQVVSEDRFNQRVATTRNKAAVLLEQVLRLLQRAGELSGEGDLYVQIDRLGGRADYRALLLDAFPRRHLHVLEVSPQRSRYRLAAQRNDWYVTFTVDADRDQLPVALASMLAKYLRELLMERFNAYWRNWMPELRPTAGYYADAQRFLTDIQPVLSRAGLTTERFVRAR